MAYLLGNGPSLSEFDLTTLADETVYGCNIIYKTYKPDYLISLWQWQIWDLLKHEVPKIIPCRFSQKHFFSFIKQKGEDPNKYHRRYSHDFDIIEMNPHEKDNADKFFVVSTHHEDHKRVKIWEMYKTYVFYLPDSYQISKLRPCPNVDDRYEPPVGAYAMNEALEDGHERLDIVGFDSVHGVVGTASGQMYFGDEGALMTRDTRNKPLWLKTYDKIESKFNDREIVWHTAKAS